MPSAESLGLPPLVSQQAVRDSYRHHAALTQFRRWYQLYENPAVSLDNQLDILSEDIALSSGLGEAKGHADYRERVANIPREWQNSHIVHRADIELLEDGAARLDADITYLNVGALPGGAVRSAELHYDGTLSTPDGALLPKFERLAIEGKSDGTADAFKDAYAENRLRSLAHYWLAAIENPTRDTAPFREMLADDFVLDFSSGQITDFDGFEAWYNGPASSVEASKHDIVEFDVTETGPNQYDMRMTLEWQGIAPGGADLVAKTHHTWQVEDNPAERFARVRRVNVELAVPFQPVARG